MPKTSKQISTTSANMAGSVLHASPVGTSQTKSPISKIPNQIKRVSDVDLVIDSSNVEISTTSNVDTKVFSIQTGLPESEPTIVLSSEFLPLYNDGEKTEQNKAILLKENAKILNSKVSIELLSQNESVVQAISSSKEELRNYVETEDSFLVRLMQLTNNTHSAMNISSYVLTSFFSAEPMGSLYEILRKGGYSSNDIVNFSETKLWQQSIVELKRTLLSHSPDLVSQNFTRRDVENDKDPFLLSDIEDTPKDIKRLWINPYYNDLPEEKDLFAQEKIDENSNKLIKFNEKQYVNLTFANSLRKTPRGFATENLRNTLDRSYFSSKILEPYEESGRDASIIANCLFKEANYSVFLTNKENSDLLSEKYNFDVSQQGDNLQLWDYVLGRFSKSVLDVVKNPTGNGNSLVSFSQEYVSSENNDYFNVLTLEDNYLENSDITPGSFYYVDSSLITADGKNFDLTRIDRLIEKTKSSHETTKTILDIMGYDVVRTNQENGFREKNVKRTVSNELSFDGLVDSLSIVGKTYQKYLRVSTGTAESGPIVTGFDYDAMKESNFYESTGVRLAAMICKAASSPTQGYKSFSTRLKSLLFLWLMNYAFLNDSNFRTESSLKEKIVSLLSSVKSKVSNYDTVEATKQARTFPFKVGSFNDSGRDDDRNYSAEVETVKYVYQKSVTSRVLNLSANSGLWGKIVEVLRAVNDNSSLFFDDKTAYSGFTRVAYMYSYFDLMLKIISSQTPEDLLGSYETNYRYETSVSKYDHENAVYRSDQQVNRSVVVSESGLIVSDAKYMLNGFFNASRILNNQPVKKTVNKLSDIDKFLKSEENLSMKEVTVFRRFFLDLGTTAQSFREFLSKNYENHLTRLKDLYSQDGSLSEKQKSSILNLTFTDEQVKMSRYVMSEFLDKISNSDSESKLRSIPAFSDLPEKFTEFLPLCESDTVSFTLLSPYFRNTQFLPKKGNNKRIISVGIPPKLNRKIRSISRISSDGLQGLVRVKVFKIDRLLPDVIFLPKSYVFDMNRFPTRVINNWDYESFLKEEFNLLRIPSKLMLSSGETKVYRDFLDSFPNEVYGNVLSEQEKLEIYSNHSISFLSEEYLRWFTDCKFDETRYNNYSQLSKTLENMESQYKKYLDLVKTNTIVSIDPNNETTNLVTAQFFDPTSGQNFQIPVKKPGATTKLVDSVTQETTKSYVIPMDKTIKSYFNNETLLSDISIYKKRISYPKKFDRVFSMIIDSDDFMIDESMTSPQVLEDLKKLGSVEGGYNEDNDKMRPYKSREADLGDVSLIEYFVTVEPYDLVQEYEE